jgi:hypothetical protein
VDLVMGSLECGAEPDLSDAKRSLDVLFEWQKNDPADALWQFTLSAVHGADGSDAQSALEAVMGKSWLEEALELCFAAEQVWPLPVRVYTSWDVYMRAYSFFRRAAETGPVFAYFVTPKFVVPLQRPLGRRGEDLNFDHGILRSFPGGLCYFQYSEQDTADALAAEAARAGPEACYRSAAQNLAEALAKPHLEVSAVRPFGWWKRRVKGTSPQEQVLAIRTTSESLGKPDDIKLAIEIRYDVLREAVPGVANPDELDTWRFVLRAFDFNTVRSRYFEERESPGTRVLRSIEDAPLTPDEALSAAKEEIGRLRHLNDA